MELLEVFNWQIDDKGEQATQWKDDFDYGENSGDDDNHNADDDDDDDDGDDDDDDDDDGDDDDDDDDGGDSDDGETVLTTQWRSFFPNWSQSWKSSNQ